MKHKFFNFLIVLLLVLSIGSTDLLINMAIAGEEPPTPVPEPESSDDPTPIILSIIGGILLVGGIGYWIHKRQENKKLKQLKDEGKIRDIKKMPSKVLIGLSSFENGNLAANENNVAATFTLFLSDALNQHGSFAVVENMSLDGARAMSGKIPYVVMGEVKLFAGVYEAQLSIMLSRTGENIYTEKFVSESIDEMKAKFQEAAPNIYQEIQNLK